MAPRWYHVCRWDGNQRTMGPFFLSLLLFAIFSGWNGEKRKLESITNGQLLASFAQANNHHSTSYFCLPSLHQDSKGSKLFFVLFLRFVFPPVPRQPHSGLLNSINFLYASYGVFILFCFIHASVGFLIPISLRHVRQLECFYISQLYLFFQSWFNMVRLKNSFFKPRVNI